MPKKLKILIRQILQNVTKNAIENHQLDFAKNILNLYQNLFGESLNMRKLQVQIAHIFLFLFNSTFAPQKQL